MSAEEKVTRSLLRYFTFPDGSTGAMITLDNGLDHNRPNTYSAGGIQSLMDALDDVERSEAKALLITGKPYSFCAGADLGPGGIMASGKTPRQIAEMGHEAYARVADLKIPSFALINGMALGGGFELALNCTYRTISTAAGVVALPEIHLGLIPGWGGAYLLPRLIGPKNAVKVIIENPLSNNKMLKPHEAAELGIADALIPSATFVADSIAWAHKVVTGQISVPRPDHTADEDGWDEAITRAKAFVKAKTHNAFPAPLRAIQLLEDARTNSRDEGFEAEDDALVALLGTPQLRASLYSFNLITRRSKKPVGVPEGAEALPVTRVGVVGGGLMASQIALLFASRLRSSVAMVEVDQERADAAAGRVRGLLEADVKKGRKTPAVAAALGSAITTSADMASLANCDLVIEAVFEEMSVKKDVFAKLEDVVSDQCLIVTNTSSLSVNEMSSHLRHPERVVGIHFFNPVAVMPLVEIIPTERTNDVTLATAFAVAGKLKKTAVKVVDSPGFVVNRILLRELAVLFAMVDDGLSIEAVRRSTDKLGLPMDPIELLDLVGPAVGLHVNETMHHAYPTRFKLSNFLTQVVGNKITKLLDDNGAVKPEVAALLPAESSLTVDDARLALENALVEELDIMLTEGVVDDVSQIDLCMLVGAGWPFAIGGGSPYLDYTGASTRVRGKAFGAA